VLTRASLGRRRGVSGRWRDPEAVPRQGCGTGRQEDHIAVQEAFGEFFYARTMGEGEFTGVSVDSLGVGGLDWLRHQLFFVHVMS
jgi:hypothetical protein